MKSLVIALSVLMLSLPSYAAFVIGSVNIQTIITQVKEGKTVVDKLQKIVTKRQDELMKEQEQLKKQQDNFQKQSLVLTGDAKDKKRQEMQEAQMKFQQKAMGYDKEIREMEANLKRPILEKVKGIIEEVSKKEKVDVTFEVSMTPIVYAKAEKDLTQKVVKLYDKKYPAKKKK